MNMITKYLIAIVAMACVPRTGEAQNLVMDPSFEQNSGCPEQVSDLSTLTTWWAPNAATTDYYHSCSPAFGSHVPYNMAGKQWPHSGNAYVGIITQANDLRYTELVQGRLVEPMKKGGYYKVAYYVSLAEIARIKDTRLGVCFTRDSTMIGNRAAPACPKGQLIERMNVHNVDDMDRWAIVTGMYKAKGGEQFMTIGNLLGSAGRKDQKKNKTTITKVKDQMGYYYIDDVTVLKARNRADSLFTAWAAPSSDEFTAGGQLLLAPCTGIFQQGSSAFRDIKAIRAAAQQDTGSVPYPAMLEYLGDMLMREPGLIMEVAVHAAPMQDTIAAQALSDARAIAVVNRFFESGVRKDQLTALGVVGPPNGNDTSGVEDDGNVFIRIVRVNKDPDLANKQPD
jgi:hypothetical protein